MSATLNNTMGFNGSVHCVYGRPNAHTDRLASYKRVDVGRGQTDTVLVRHSPYVNRWLKQLEAEDMGSDDAALMARPQAMPVPSCFKAMAEYKTHSQRMSEFFRQLDKANKAKPAVEWRPISAERAEWLASDKDGKFSEQAAKSRQKQVDAATKRGDIIPNIPNIL